MADNRLYLRCRACGEELYLGKRLGAGYYWSNYGKEHNESHTDDPNWKKQDERLLEDRLNQFYKDHEWCEGAGLDCFELRYETSPMVQSNANRIRALGDEALAYYLYAVQSMQKITPIDWLKWLKEEDKNDNS